jgi:hypothetical protein
MEPESWSGRQDRLAARPSVAPALPEGQPDMSDRAPLDIVCLIAFSGSEICNAGNAVIRLSYGKVLIAGTSLPGNK